MAHRHDIAELLTARAKSAMYVYLAAIEQAEIDKLLEQLSDAEKVGNTIPTDDKSVGTHVTEVLSLSLSLSLTLSLLSGN